MMVYELRGPLIEPPPPQSNLETCIRSLNTPNSSFQRLENSRNIVNIKFKILGIENICFHNKK